MGVTQRILVERSPCYLLLLDVELYDALRACVVVVVLVALQVLGVVGHLGVV